MHSSSTILCQEFLPPRTDPSANPQLPMPLSPPPRGARPGLTSRDLFSSCGGGSHPSVMLAGTLAYTHRWSRGRWRRGAVRSCALSKHLAHRTRVF